MKKTVKQMLSVLLCILMLCSVMTAAVTSAGAVLNNDGTNTLYICTTQALGDTQVNIFTWNVNGYRVEVNADYPGVPMVPMGVLPDGKYYYSYTCSDSPQNLIINTGISDEQKLTGDVEIPEGYDCLDIDIYNSNREDYSSAWSVYADRTKYSITAQLKLSAKQVKAGEEVVITPSVKSSTIPQEENAEYTYSLKVGGKELSTSLDAYTYIAEGAGNVAVEFTVSAKNSAEEILAYSAVNTTLYIIKYAAANATDNGLYVHAVKDSTELQAWQCWQNKNGTRYFYLPSSVKNTGAGKAEILNTFGTDVTVNGVTIAPGEIASVPYEPDKAYTVNGQSLIFIESTAEAAIYLNNPTASSSGLWAYMSADKNNSASATAALVNQDGTFDNTAAKKIKGRGNTTWRNTAKKPFNLTYEAKVSVDGMEATKKYSLLANFQDPALSRNRVLYDLADAAGVPYSSDSRTVDVYFDGVYKGSYQMAQKIDFGSGNMMSDINGDYLDEQGNVLSDFQFVFQVDPNSEAGDYTAIASNGERIEIKYPELTTSDTGYEQVKQIIADKLVAMCDILKNENATYDDINKIVDVKSLAGFFLINELSKNWDAGVASTYFTYKQDKNGDWKLFASPVWDFDNSLGNAVGSAAGFYNYSTHEYMSPMHYWSYHKIDQSGDNITDSSYNNIIGLSGKNTVIMKAATTTWIEDFLPAIEGFYNNTNVAQGELYSKDVYKNYLDGSQRMNYMQWSMTVNNDWISNHSSLDRAEAINVQLDENENPAAADYTTVKTSYDQNTFSGQYDFMADWMYTRAAWLTKNLLSDYGYTPSEKESDPEPIITTDGKHSADTRDVISGFVFDNSGVTEGDALANNGSKGTYAQTIGNDAVLTTAVNAIQLRALEWGVNTEYYYEDTESGKTLYVPILPAGKAAKNNSWGGIGEQIIQMQTSATGKTGLSFEFAMAGSKKAPRDWKVQYSTDGQNYTDVDNSNITIEESTRKLLKRYSFKLPSECDNRESLYIRIISTSNITVSGGLTSDDPEGGEIAINDIMLKGADISGKYMLGDANADSEITMRDILAIQQDVAKINRLAGVKRLAADVNANGELDMSDVLEIQKYLAKISTAYQIGGYFEKSE